MSVTISKGGRGIGGPHHVDCDATYGIVQCDLFDGLDIRKCTRASLTDVEQSRRSQMSWLASISALIQNCPGNWSAWARVLGRSVGPISRCIRAT